MPESLGMAPTKQQERFGDLFLHAVAYVAGCDASRPQADDDSIDWMLSCRGLPKRPRLDVQMKTTTTDGGSGEIIRYALKRKNYADLIIQNPLAPRILVVVTLPPDVDSWLAHTSEQLALRRCAYWVSLAGMPESSNETSVTVSLPRTNLLTVGALGQMMRSIDEKGSL